MSEIVVVDWSPEWAEQFAADPAMDIETYLAGKSAVLQRALRASGTFTDDELAAIERLNDATA